MSAPRKITITMDDQGDFTYSPSTLHAKIGESVYWTTKKGPFAISFMDHTPFLAVSYSSTPDNQGNHNIDPIAIQENTIGHHHYAVALALTIPAGPDFPLTTTVMLDSGCPDIVVSDN